MLKKTHYFLLVFSLIVTAAFGQSEKDLALLEKGDQEAQEKNYSGAIGYYDMFLSKFPENSSAWFKRGVSNFNKVNSESAYEDFSKSISFDRSNWQAFFYRGVTLYRMSQRSEAINDYDECLSIDPSNFHCKRQKVWALRDLRQYEEAMTLLNELVELKPNDPVIWNGRSQIHFLMGNLDKAISDVDKAIELNKSFLNNKTYMLNEAGKFEMAFAVHQQDLEENPSNFESLNSFGYHFLVQRKFAEAISYFEKSKALNKNDFKAPNNLATALNYLGRHEEAKANADLAINLDPYFANAYRHRADAEFHLGDIYAAEMDVNRAIELNPNYAKSYLTRGLIYESQNKLEAAQRDFQKALELTSTFDFFYSEPYEALKRVEKTIGVKLPPEIIVSSPVEQKSRGFKVKSTEELIEIADEMVLVQGVINTVNDLQSVSVNGELAQVDNDNYFDAGVELSLGQNEIVVRAVDGKGQESEVRFSVTRTAVIGGNEVVDTEIDQAGKYYAIIIGVEEYDHPQVNDLDKPVADAIKIRNTLTNYYQFDQSNIKLLTNPSREDVFSAFDEMTNRVTDNDNLLIFYAGHGHWDPKFKKGYWLLKDATPGSRGTWFSNTALRDYIQGIPSRHTLLIADACFSGGIFKTRNAFSEMQVVERLHETPSRKAMTSGALKTVPDQSVFIKYLIKRLEENDRPYLSSEELFASFKRAVMLNSTNIPQYGEIHGTGGEGGDFIFARE